MSIKEGFGKKVTFNTLDSIEQNIDKLMVMRGKLVMEDAGQVDNLSHKYISLIVAEARLDVTITGEDSKIGLDQTRHTEDDQGMDKTTKVGQGMIIIIEVVTGTIQEVIKGMEDKIIITEGKTLGNRLMIEIGVGAYKRQNRDRRDGRNINNSRSRSGSMVTTNR